MKRYLHWSLLLVFVIAQGCGPSKPDDHTVTPTSRPGNPSATATSTPVIYADTFFSGRAYVDLNENRLLDQDDPPLPGASFSVMGFGSVTDKTGYAWALIPGGWDKPVTARMTPPANSGYVLIGSGEVILQSGKQTSANFLFAPPPVPTATLP